MEPARLRALKSDRSLYRPIVERTLGRDHSTVRSTRSNLTNNCHQSLVKPNHGKVFVTVCGAYARPDCALTVAGLWQPLGLNGGLTRTVSRTGKVLAPRTRMVSRATACGLRIELPAETVVSICTPLPCFQPDRNPAFRNRCPWPRRWKRTSTDACRKTPHRR